MSHLVLMHGFGILVNRYLPHHMTKVASFFRKEGFAVHFPQVSPYHDSAIRLAQWKTHLQSINGDIHLIGHSQGGREAILLAGDPDVKERIRSVHAIASPITGNRSIQMLKLLPPFARKQLFKALDDAAIRKFPDLPSSIAHASQSLADSIHVPEPANCPINAYVCHVPHFGFHRLPPFFWATHVWQLILDGNNDGLVSARGQRIGTVHGPFVLHHGGQLGLFVHKNDRAEFERLWHSVAENIRQSS